MPEKKDAKANIHATCIAIGGHGVLLLGPSGAGKSDLSLRLIDGGAKLVADDRTLVFVRRGRLHARAPGTIKGLLEVRGIGIVKLPVKAQVRLVLVVRLGKEGARLPQPQFWRSTLKGAKLPQIALDPRFASTPAKIRIAAKAFSRGLFRDIFDLN